ncbi:putative carboxylesterase 17 [Hibiscus syriacus]|uniref:Carboxylesterase 17 n=1 Tax=Hibiscus syriacus TaxID=106335 RepID=A0A6A2WST6_HIBSY|nr:putative carboxylesterase 17 [Hibiscus syriacus]
MVFSDGSVKRFAPEIAPATEESCGGFKSKDVIIDPLKAITGRIFLPDIPGPCTLLPVLIYFHGGGFCIGSTTWLGYHHFLGDFLLCPNPLSFLSTTVWHPKNRLPIAYNDCYSSLEWLCNQFTNEPWLKQADLSRVFLSGDSAGGNIVHQKEREDGAAGYVAMNDMFWRLSIPDWSNRDYYGCNFENKDVSDAEWREFPAVVIYVAGLDF